MRNDLSALDTRLTNAIDGGDLAAPYTVDLYYKPYTNGTTLSKAYISKNTQSDLWYNHKAYHADSGKIYRIYSDSIKIVGTKYNLTVKGGLVSTYAGRVSDFRAVIIDASTGAELAYTPITQQDASKGNATLTASLASLAGKTVKIKVECNVSAGDYGCDTGLRVSSVIVSNQ